MFGTWNNELSSISPCSKVQFLGWSLGQSKKRLGSSSSPLIDFFSLYFYPFSFLFDLYIFLFLNYTLYYLIYSSIERGGKENGKEKSRKQTEKRRKEEGNEKEEN
jgi:hypothetical protein